MKIDTIRRTAASVLMLAGVLCIGNAFVPRPDAIAPVEFDQLGLAPNHSEAAAVVASQTPRFLLVGDAASEDNTKKNVRLWEPMLALRGEHFPNKAQEIGDCVSWGAANAVNYLQAVQLTRGPPDAFQFAAADPPYIYGTSRVVIGGKHGSHFRGDGSVGAYAAEALRDCGCLKATHPQCPPYAGSRAKEWGDKGPPQWARDAAKVYTVQSIAQVKTADDIRDAVCHGFPVTVASDWGTKSIRPQDGRNVAKHDGLWPHQMCCIAYDGSGSSPYWYLLNSWGPNAHPAPLQSEPPGGFWIDRKSMNYIASQGDCWALSGFDGFPAEELDWDQLLHRSRATVGAAGPPLPLVPEPNVMVPQILCGILLLATGVALLSLGNARRSRLAAMLLLALTLAVPTAAFADEPSLDFSVAASRSAAREVATPPEPEPEPFMSLNWSLCEGHALAAANGPQPQCLVFVRSRNCSDCHKETAYIERVVKPLGWTVGPEPTADFRVIDVLNDTALQSSHGVQVVPTTIYLDRRGREVLRFEGFTPPRSLTEPLNKLRRTPLPAPCPLSPRPGFAGKGLG